MALTKPKLSQNIDTDVSVFRDPILVLHQGSTSANLDVGFLMNRSNGLTSNAAVIWQESSKSFVHILTNSSGAADANLAVQSYANVSVGNVLLINNAGIYVDGTLGSAGQVLASDGFKSYWATSVFTGGVVGNTTIFESNLVVSNTTSSTSNVTGALVVLGGAGIAGNVYAGKIYTSEGLYWAGNGNVIVTGSGGGAGGVFTASNTAPAGPNPSDFWYKISDDILLQYISDGTSDYWVDVQSPTLFANTAGTMTSLGETTIAGNLIPSANLVYSLGSQQFQWKDLWVSNNTIYIGNTPIRVDNGVLLVNNATVGGTYSNVNVEAYIGGNIGAFQTFSNANAATQATSLTTIDANIGAFQTFSNANAATQATSINTIDANVGAYQTYANTKIGTNTNSNLVVIATTSSISTTTGALIVAGGAGIAGNVTADRLTTNTGVFYANNTSYNSDVASLAVAMSIIYGG